MEEITRGTTLIPESPVASRVPMPASRGRVAGAGSGN